MPELEIVLIAIAVAAACSLVGCFLVLRRMAMLSDAITHTILLGIVAAFFVAGDLNSPLLMLGAALMGVVTVYFTETLHKTRLMSEDSAIGIVFPLLFSIAIVLITRYAGSVHLDTDAVLRGELAFAPYDRLVLGGRDIGPRSLYVMGAALALNLAAVLLFYKELKLSTFDAVTASLMGFMPALLHYLIMTLVSVTAVAAFDSVGSILVVAFMIGPPSAAYLLTDKLKYMLAISCALGAAAAVLGYLAASALDVSIAGSIAVMIGLIFAAVFVFSPKKGLITDMLRKHRQKRRFYEDIMLFYFYKRKEASPNETPMENARIRLGWKKNFCEKTASRLLGQNKICYDGESVKLTESGKEYCIETYKEYFG